MNILNKSLRFAFIFFFLFSIFSFKLKAQEITQTPIPLPTQVQDISENDARKIYVAEVVDAEEIEKASLVNASNSQMLTLRLVGSDKNGVEVETALIFPTTQFKSPLRVGDKVLIESIGDLGPNSKINLLSKYRQNNLLIWAFMLVGLLTLVSGFRANIKYFQIFIISAIGGLMVLFLYHRNTYLTFLSLFAWFALATLWFAFRVFKKRIPSLVLVFCVVANLILSMGLVFIMKNISLFDTSFFELFFTISYNARQVMIYLFPIMVVYPMSVVFAEQIISESIKKKKEESDILKINMIQHISRSALKNLNTIFLTFFGLFFAIFVGVIAIASRENLVFQVINSSSLSQILSVGFLILFNLLIFVPLVSFAVGMWLGRFEAHELITDQNLKQLEL
jgi:hypothetical protein